MRLKHLMMNFETIEDNLEAILLGIPNIPHESVPVGETEDDNVDSPYMG